jgi:hypothetical protein
MAFQRLGVDHMDYFLRACNVCRHRSTSSQVVTEVLCCSYTSKALPTTPAPVVGLFTGRYLPVLLSRVSHISNMDISSPAESTDLLHCKSMVHVSTVVPKGIRVGATSRPIPVCTNTSLEICHSDTWHDCRNRPRNLECRCRRIWLGSRRHRAVFDVYCGRHGLALFWQAITAQSSRCYMFLFSCCRRVVDVSTAPRRRREQRSCVALVGRWFLDCAPSSIPGRPLFILSNRGISISQ